MGALKFQEWINMTKEEAVIKLNKINCLIFEIESQMDINKSFVRRIGYDSRLSIARFIDAIKNSPENKLKNV